MVEKLFLEIKQKKLYILQIHITNGVSIDGANDVCRESLQSVDKPF